MKNLSIVLLLTAATLGAQTSAARHTTDHKAAKSAVTGKKVTTAPKLTVIPKDAVTNPDGSFSWTDPQGKKWTYVKTPFGIMRSAVNDQATSSLAGVKAYDEGDKIRFEKPSPFGTIKWEKNEVDLTDEERSLLNKQAAARNAKQD